MSCERRISPLQRPNVVGDALSADEGGEVATMGKPLCDLVLRICITLATLSTGCIVTTLLFITSLSHAAFE